MGERADAPDLRGARGGALARHHSSRRQAVELVRDLAARWQRAREGARFRNLEVAARHGHAADPDAVPARHARVYVARANAIRPARRYALRYLVARHGVLRAARGP